MNESEVNGRNGRRIDMTDLFTPMDLRGLKLHNRIWMSAMTRTRASEANVPTALMAHYYAQRATAGLIVTDCTAVSEQGKGVINGPGIWRQDQIEGWRTVTDAMRRPISRDRVVVSSHAPNRA